MYGVSSAANSSLTRIEVITAGQSLDCGVVIRGIVESEIANSVVLWPDGLAMHSQKSGILERLGHHMWQKTHRFRTNGPKKIENLGKPPNKGH
jgi:hypothetical protein